MAATSLETWAQTVATTDQPNLIIKKVKKGGGGGAWRAVAARVEYDSEKWNLGIGVDLGFGLRLRAAALNLETLSGGVGWFHEL